jgi:glycerol-3-phosphate dehydrogenase
MQRKDMLDRARESGRIWDIAVIGGGATGVGIALDAATRGYSVVLLEQADFAKGTSSRSTKLAHGGVRYLQQGNLSLVLEALHERERLRRNAPDLVHDQAFLVPNYQWWEKPYYGVGLLAYGLLAGKSTFGGSRLVSRDEALRRVPTLQPARLKGAVEYHDGQFDDARLLLQTAHTAARHGAVLVNYCPVVNVAPGGRTLTACDNETGVEFSIEARVIVNATGPFCDAVRRMADPQALRLIAPSQGAHLVLDRSFLPGDTAILVPRTPDGRVMFAIPWLGHALVGTTDVPVSQADLEPRPLDDEIRFILETAGQYLAKTPRREDILSCWAGIRPLVKREGAASTAALSRDHLIEREPSGMITITGGKWTTFRRMAEDCVNIAAAQAGLDKRPSGTPDLPLDRLPASTGERLHPALPYTTGDVQRAVQEEMARTVEDVLARRTRALFLNARAALAMTEHVADLMARELGANPEWAPAQIATFRAVAHGYLPG